MHENTKIKYDISKLIQGEIKRKFWKLDTSHYSILKKFLPNHNEGLILLNPVNEDNKSFDIISPHIINKKDKSDFGISTISQYIRILLFYNVIDYEEIIKINPKSWVDLIRKIAKDGIVIKYSSIEVKDYLKNNKHKIVKAIKDKINCSNKLIRKETIKFLVNMEIFLNFTSSLEEYKFNEEGFIDFLENYAYDVIEIDKNYPDELANMMQMYEYTKEIFNLLLNTSSVEIGENINYLESDEDIDFEGFGYVGEYIYNEYLRKNTREKFEWTANKEKYSPYDFKVGDKYIEIKTPTKNRSKISFHLSWNEFKKHELEKERYIIYFIDGVYNLELKHFFANEINDINKFMKEKNITLKRILYNEIKDLNFFPKGYWVKEK